MAVWNEFFKQEGSRWRDPDQQVVELAGQLKNKGAQRVLDLGCGAGRHLVYLARQDFKMYGIDIAENGLELARQWVEREELQADAHLHAPLLVRCDMAYIPFRDGFFDALIGIHVIQHQTTEGIHRTMGEIRRVLHSGGLAYLTFPSTRDRRYGQGKEIEPNTFIAEAGPDSGVPHHYSNLAEIEGLFEGFALRKVELDDRSNERGDRFSHWNVLAEKE